jgi:hypothetical protein
MAYPQPFHKEREQRTCMMAKSFNYGSPISHHWVCRAVMKQVKNVVKTLIDAFISKGKLKQLAL